MLFNFQTWNTLQIFTIEKVAVKVILVTVERHQFPLLSPFYED